MRLDHLSGEVHLTYYTNIHGGETWPEVHASLSAHVPGIKAKVSSDAPMGLGLRLSAAAAQELSTAAAFAQLRDFLAAHDLYVFTVNAFPYGSFHGTRVKEHVYQPDWLTAERAKQVLVKSRKGRPACEGCDVCDASCHHRSNTSKGLVMCYRAPGFLKALAARGVTRACAGKRWRARS